MSNPILISDRSKEEIAAIEKEHGHLLMAPGFTLLNSPIGILWVDQRHPEYKGIIGQCIRWVRIHGINDTAEKYEKLLKDLD